MSSHASGIMNTEPCLLAALLCGTQQLRIRSRIFNIDPFGQYTCSGLRDWQRRASMSRHNAPLRQCRHPLQRNTAGTEENTLDGPPINSFGRNKTRTMTAPDRASRRLHRGGVAEQVDAGEGGLMEISPSKASCVAGWLARLTRPGPRKE